MLAPQFLHIIPIEPIVGPDPIEPIGIAPIGWGGIAPGTIDGLKTIARIPPIRPRRKPITKPPTAVNQLSIDKTRTIIPHILADVGLEYIMTAPTIMTSPKMIPTTPTTVTTVPGFAPPLARYPKDATNDPTNAMNRPPRITKIPPSRDNTIAAVGLSAKFDHDKVSSQNI
jgi:hypothetical protein